MEQHINTYGGLNEDIAYDSIPQNLYIDARNIRITTTTGESQGAAINFRGTEFTFEIPQAGPFHGYRGRPP